MALLQHDLGQAAQKSGQLGDLPAGVGRGGPNQKEGQLGMEEGHFGVASPGTPRGHAAPP